MKTGLLVVLAALSVAGVGILGATAVMAPAAGGMSGMPAGMGHGSMGTGMHGGMMDGGAMMSNGTCGCRAACQQQMLLPTNG